MNKFIKILTAVLCVTMLLGPAAANAAEEKDNCTQPPSDPPLLAVDKTAAIDSEEERIYSVVLSVQGASIAHSNPADVVLVMDASSGMVSPDPNKLNNLKGAVKDVINAVLAENPVNRIALVKFNSVSTRLTSFSSDAGYLKGVVDSIGINYGTNMQAGMIDAMQAMADSNDSSSKIIIIFSDGIPNMYYYMTEPVLGGFNAAARAWFILAALNTKAAYPGCRIYTVGLLSGMDDEDKDHARSTLNPGNAGEDYVDEYFEFDGSIDITPLIGHIGSDVEHSPAMSGFTVTDTIPAEFELLKDSIRINGVSVAPGGAEIDYDEETGVITWTSETPRSASNTLEYSLKARPYYCGIIDTNTKAVLTAYYPDRDPISLDFPNPEVPVRPYAQDDSYTFEPGATLSIPVTTGVLANDWPDDELNHSTEDSISLSAEVATLPSNGQLEFNPDGSFSYTPDDSSVTSDSFTYRKCMTATGQWAGTYKSDEATVKITSKGMEQPDNPPTNDDKGGGYSTTEYVSLTVAIEGQGSVLPGEGVYSRAKHSVQLFSHISPDEGWYFDGWYGASGSEVTDDGRLVMDGNKSVVARFLPVGETEPEVEPEAVQEYISTSVPESVPEAVIEDDIIPMDQPLPRTGGLPAEILMGAGFMLVSLGVIRRKSKG